MRTHLSVALLVLWLLPACSRSKPNVVLITFDTTRADAVGYANGRADVTPNLDKLAASGAWFSTAITSQPLTMPAHSTIMTGLYPYRHGVRNNGTYILDKSNLTLAERLKASGYATHAVVSSFVLDSQFGLDQGFDTYDDDMSGGPQQKMFMFREIRGNQTANKAIAWLKSKRPENKPFFLWVHFFDAHADYEPPDEIAQRFPGERYQAEIAYADQELGRVLKTLDELKLTKDTLIAFSADHGESLGDHGERSHGIFVYDSTVQVPMFFAGKRIPKKGRVDPVVRTADITPTILDLLGLDDDKKLDGVSLLPLINGEATPPRTAYSESFAPRLNFGWSELRAVRDGNVKYIAAPRPEAYDVVRDAGESKNLMSGGSVPAPARRLAAETQRVQKEDPFTTGKHRQQKLDAETMRKLAALGYVWGSEPATSGPRPDPKDRIVYWEQFQEAQMLIRKHEYAPALQMVRAVLEVDRDNVVAMASLANVLTKMNARTEALEVFRRMIQIDPERDMPYLGASRTLRELGRFEEAEAYARTIMRIQPENPDGYTSAGDVMLDQNRYAEAEGLFRQALKVDPHSAIAISGLGNCLNRAGRLRDALAVLRKGREQDPTSQPIVYNLAVVVERLGDNVGAKRLYEDAIKLDAEHSMAWNNLGAIHDREGKREEAIKCVVRARQADPANLEAAYNLGVLLMRANRPADALPQLNDALRLNPQFAPAALQRARALTVLGKKEQALAAWKALTAAMPGAWLQVARLELSLGNEKEARAALKQGLDLGGAQAREAARQDEGLRKIL
jgi:arylsulfatase A-like enzyme/Tfp pilus assembly protein PilF